MFQKFLPRSPYARNVITLMTGTGLAQAIPVAISPILTRLYSPEDFGVFALYLATVSIVSVLVTGRYELAIFPPKRDRDARQDKTLSSSHPREAQATRQLTSLRIAWGSNDFVKLHCLQDLSDKATAPSVPPHNNAVKNK